jgi:hypothetical protein
MMGFMMGDFSDYASPWTGPGAGLLIGFGVIGVLLIAVWSIYWKGMALWHAARKGEKVWFVVLLVVNTVGILEILYLYVFSKKTEPMK